MRRKVVGVTFDDEWVKQAKVNKFAAESCVYEYNQITRNGTRSVPNLLQRCGCKGRTAMAMVEEIVRCARGEREEMR